MIFDSGALSSMKSSIFSAASKITTTTMISAMANTYVPKNLRIM